jgi:hypothetical protein
VQILERSVGTIRTVIGDHDLHLLRHPIILPPASRAAQAIAIPIGIHHQSLCFYVDNAANRPFIPWVQTTCATPSTSRSLRARFDAKCAPATGLSGIIDFP